MQSDPSVLEARQVLIGGISSRAASQPRIIHRVRRGSARTIRHPLAGMQDPDSSDSGGAGILLLEGVHVVSMDGISLIHLVSPLFD